MTTQKNDFMMPIIVIIGIFILTLLLLATTYPIKRPVRYVQESPVSKTAAAVVPYEGSQHVFVIDQDAAGRISMTSLSLLKSGFLVISDKKTDKPLKVSNLLEPGLYTGGSVALSESVAPGQVLVANLYIDDGNGIFDKADKIQTEKSEFTILGV